MSSEVIGQNGHVEIIHALSSSTYYYPINRFQPDCIYTRMLRELNKAFCFELKFIYYHYIVLKFAMCAISIFPQLNSM